jgi:hypothetical protein
LVIYFSIERSHLAIVAASSGTSTVWLNLVDKQIGPSSDYSPPIKAYEAKYKDEAAIQE